MSETKSLITSAYQHGEIGFSLWMWCINKLEKIQRSFCLSEYDEVIKKFDEERHERENNRKQSL